MADERAGAGLTYLLENLRGMCAFYEPYGRCEQSRELRDFCTPCRAAAEIDRLRSALRAQEIVKTINCLTCQGRGWVMCSESRDLGNGLGSGGAWNEPCPVCHPTQAPNGTQAFDAVPVPTDHT